MNRIRTRQGTSSVARAKSINTRDMRDKSARRCEQKRFITSHNAAICKTDAKKGRDKLTMLRDSLEVNETFL